MRFVLALLLVGACGGPTQQQLVETPSATTPARAVEAPPASTSDKDRERLTQSFDDMQTTQNAYGEAKQEQAKPPPGTTLPTQGKGKAPVEQAPADDGTPKKRKAPVEQAPKK